MKNVNRYWLNILYYYSYISTEKAGIFKIECGFRARLTKLHLRCTKRHQKITEFFALDFNRSQIAFNCYKFFIKLDDMSI